MEKRQACNLNTGRDEEIEIDVERRDGFRYWPSRHINFFLHARRIAPKAPVFILPRQPGDPYGRHEADVGGRVTVFGEMNVYEQATMFHELWHHAEWHLLSSAECEIVYRVVRQGDSWCSTYLDSDSERAARAFEHYASTRAHGLNLAPAKKGSAQEVFQKIYEGRAHNECERRRRQERWKPWIEWGGAVAGAGSVGGFFIFVLPHLLTH